MNEKKDPSYDPAVLDEIFGKVCLLKGEDRSKHDKLQEAVSQALCPETLFDAIDAREITSSIWEEQLFRKMSQKLIDSNRFKAFENLLINNADQLIGKQGDWIKTIENGRCPDGMTEAEALKKAGLSLVLRQATTVIMAQEDIPQFERLIENRVKARTSRLKEYERRKKIRARILKNNPKGSS